MWQIYERPDSIEQALTLLAEYDGRAQVIAGGTDLIIELQEGEHSVECLVDVTRIPGLDRIERQNGWIVLGANVTFRQLKESPLIQDQARVLAEAAGTVGAFQIQTMATLAGNDNPRRRGPDRRCQRRNVAPLGRTVPRAGQVSR